MEGGDVGVAVRVQGVIVGRGWVGRGMGVGVLVMCGGWVRWDNINDCPSITSVAPDLTRNCPVFDQLGRRSSEIAQSVSPAHSMNTLPSVLGT